MAEAVLDSSAVLSIFHGEPGSAQVLAVVGNAMMSAVNHAEVLRHLIDQGLPLAEARAVTERLGYAVTPADQGAAVTVGTLQEHTRRRGVSLGDGFCLALGMEARLPVLTSDRTWAKLGLDVEVRLIR